MAKRRGNLAAMFNYGSGLMWLAACAQLGGCSLQESPRVSSSAQPAAQQAVAQPKVRQPSRPAGPVLTVRGEQIVSSLGEPIVLRGVAFGNQVWGDVAVPRLHHSELDYQRVHDMGMNAVRFYLNHISFEDSKERAHTSADGWKWLDDNIAWAKAHGVYLILNLHVPPGGYQSQGNGTALWTDVQAQQQFLDLWQTIADRYRGEPVIAGYDILNEPVVTKSREQWRDLADRAVKAIRQVDPEHILFVERLNAAGGEWGEDKDRNFFRVPDPNVVYEFHFYKPFHFTHQNAPWVNFAAVDQRYPDERVAEIEWFNLDYRTASYQSPYLPAGTTPWTRYEGAPITVTDPALAVGKPALACDKVGNGTAYFDDLVLDRLEQGKAVETMWQDPLQTKRGWYFWSQDKSGHAAEFSAGHADSLSLSITGTRSYANLGSDARRFLTKPGATYRLSGWMRGENIPRGSRCQIQLQLYASKVPPTRRNAEFLKQELGAYLAWGAREHVPLFLGEWGAIQFAFEGDRGGLRWVSDMLDILLVRNVSFTYHDYHEDAFGLFHGEGSLPDPNQANQELIEMFRKRLNSSAPSPPNASAGHR